MYSEHNLWPKIFAFYAYHRLQGPISLAVNASWFSRWLVLDSLIILTFDHNIRRIFSYCNEILWSCVIVPDFRMVFIVCECYALRMHWSLKDTDGVLIFFWRLLLVVLRLLNRSFGGVVSFDTFFAICFDCCSFILVGVDIDFCYCWSPIRLTWRT